MFLCCRSIDRVDCPLRLGEVDGEQHLSGIDIGSEEARGGVMACMPAAGK
jgi:hypothetical protein